MPASVRAAATKFRFKQQQQSTGGGWATFPAAEKKEGNPKAGKEPKKAKMRRCYLNSVKFSVLHLI